MEAIMMPTILANSEMLTKLTKGEIEELEKMQKENTIRLPGDTKKLTE